MPKLPTLEELKQKNPLKDSIKKERNKKTEKKKEITKPKKLPIVKNPIEHKQKKKIKNKKNELEELKKYIKGKIMANKQNKEKTRVKSPIRDARETIEDLETINNIRSSRERPNMNDNPDILDSVMDKKMVDANFDNVNNEHLAYILSQNNNGSVNAIKYRDMLKKIEVIKSITGRDGLTKEDLALLLNQMNQQSPQPQGFDMNNYMMFQMLNKYQNTPKDNKELEFLRQENQRLREQQRDDRLVQAINQMGANIQGKGNEFDIFKQGMGFAKDIWSEKSNKTDTELKYNLESRKLDLDQKRQEDMLDREERALIREEEKSQTYLNIAKDFSDKIIGQGLGNLVGQLADTFTKTKKGSKKGDELEFDSSLLDEL